MVANGQRRRRQLTPGEKWQVFLGVVSQQISQADAARKWNVDVSTVIKVRRLAKDGALAAFAASKPGRPRSVEQVELEACRVECARLIEAVKERAIELALLRGRQRSGFVARSPLD
jgi:transposase